MADPRGNAYAVTIELTIRGIDGDKVK